jgi:NADH pyrophosphatase NudC (nudix superfamily)
VHAPLDDKQQPIRNCGECEQQRQATAKVIAAVASAAWNHMMFPPFTPALIAEVVVSERLVH